MPRVRQDRNFDERGCLTRAGIAAVRRAPAGAAPIELAAHVAGCASCQGRVLRSEGLNSPQPRNVVPPPWRRALVVVGLLIAALGALVATPLCVRSRLPQRPIRSAMPQ